MQILSRNTEAVLNPRQQADEITWNTGDSRCPECSHELGCDVYHRNKFGDSPLSLACVKDWRRRPNYERQAILAHMRRPTPKPAYIAQVK